MIETLTTIGGAILIVIGLLILLGALSILYAAIKGIYYAISGKGPTKIMIHSRTYTVQDGETLFQICDREDVKWEDVMRLNALRDKDDIKPGQRLLLAEAHYHNR